MRLANDVVRVRPQRAQNAVCSPASYNNQVGLLLCCGECRRLCNRVFHQIDVEVRSCLALQLRDLLLCKLHKESMQVGIKVTIRRRSVIRNAVDKADRGVKLTRQVAYEA
jgi:hypothetical protein